MNNEMTTNNMSNEEVIDVLKGIVFNGFDRTTPKEREALHLAIKALEERPQGEWIKEQVTPASCTYVCSECGIEEVILSNFCRYCGADMRKGGEEE